MRIQLASVVLVIAALMTAEYAALALAAQPGSTFLWWLNLEVFRGINATHHWLPDAVYPLDYHVTIGGLAALLGLALAAYWWKVRLALAIFSNLAFIYCGVLAYESFGPAGAVETASLVPVPLPVGSGGGALALYLLLASLCGAAAAHLSYFARISGLRRRAAAQAALPGAARSIRERQAQQPEQDR